jgi:hypothetical protein
MIGGTITGLPGVPRTFGDGEAPDSWPLGQDFGLKIDIKFRLGKLEWFLGTERQKIKYLVYWYLSIYLSMCVLHVVM